MDERPNVRKEINDFIRKYNKFVEELKILSNLRDEYCGKTDTEYEMKKWQFKKTAEVDVDRAWLKLTEKEKNELFSV